MSAGIIPERATRCRRLHSARPPAGSCPYSHAANSVPVGNAQIVGERQCDVGRSVELDRPLEHRPVELAHAAVALRGRRLLGGLELGERDPGSALLGGAIAGPPGAVVGGAVGAGGGAGLGDRAEEEVDETEDAPLR